jgi:hemerythrin-like domain-containing protein
MVAQERATEAWRAEHEALRRETAQLARLASGLSDWSVPDTPDELQRIRGFLQDRLLEHAEAEEKFLYPVMDELLGVEQFTASMRADHEAIRYRTEELAAVIAAVDQGSATTSQVEALREHLYGLWAIIEPHLDKEEQILFDLLDAQLTPVEVRSLHDQSPASTSRGPGHVIAAPRRPLTHTEHD